MKKMLSFGLVILFLTACSRDEPTGIDLTVSNNGQTIEMQRNQTLNIKLDSNITTGYQWNQVTPPDEKVLKFVSSQYNAPNTNLVGAGGRESWQYQAVAPGTTSFKLAYFRPFDRANIAGEFSVNVTVK